MHSFEINNGFDFYTYLKQPCAQITNSYHEAIHQVDKHQFHYFPVGHSWQTILVGPKLSAVKPYYIYAVCRTGLPGVKTIFSGGICAHVYHVQLVTFIAACVNHFVVCRSTTKLFFFQ